LSVAESITVAIAAGVVVGGRAGCRDEGGRKRVRQVARERRLRGGEEGSQTERERVRED